MAGSYCVVEVEVEGLVTLGGGRRVARCHTDLLDCNGGKLAAIEQVFDPGTSPPAIGYRTPVTANPAVTGGG